MKFKKHDLIKYKYDDFYGIIMEVIPDYINPGYKLCWGSDDIIIPHTQDFIEHAELITDVFCE